MEWQLIGEQFAVYADGVALGKPEQLQDHILLHVARCLEC